MTLWRICNFEDLKGIGGFHAAARWHHKGREVVYMAESIAAAMLEVLVHFECAPDEVPENFKLLEVDIPDTVAIAALDESALPHSWVDDLQTSRAIGDEWLGGRSSLLLRVPSAVIPRSYNHLFNPLHLDAGDTQIMGVTTHPFDQRLLELAAGT